MQVSVQNGPFRVTVEFADDDKALVGLKDVLKMAEDATRGAVGPATSPAQQTTATGPANLKVAEWWGHLGSRSKEFWESAAVLLGTTGSFTFEELARATGVDKGALKAEHRNSWKAIKDESAPDPLDGKWDASRGCMVYSMKDEVRRELLRLAGVIAAPATEPQAGEVAIPQTVMTV
jgi:hypothetical protein